MSKSSTVTVRERPVEEVASATAGGLTIHGETIIVSTDQRIELVDLTNRIMEFARRFNIREGLVSLWSMHTTCSLFINEFQTALLTDIKRFLEQMVARDAEWMHNNPDHSDCDRMNADSHLRALMLGHSLTLQVSGGEVVLGQWQRILMAELDGPRARTLRIQIWGNYPEGRGAMRSRLADAHLLDIADKLDAGIRLTLEDGVRLFDSPDLLAVGWLANREREKRHGPKTFYNYNIRVEATNVCVASCLFCSFARLKPGDADAYTMSLDEAWDKLRRRAAQPLTEVHVVNGLHPDLPFDYYTELLRGFKRIRPGHSPEVLHRGRDRLLRGPVRQDRRAGAARADGRRASTRCPAAAPRSSPSACARRSATTSAAPIATSTFTASPTGSACART